MQNNEKKSQYRLRMIIIRATGREISEIEVRNGRWFAHCVDGWTEVGELLRRGRFSLLQAIDEVMA